jgi:hypothetical protein
VLVCGAVTAFWTLGCVRFPSENAVLALDYQIDKARVAGIRLDPPVLAHGLPTSVDALVLAPPGEDAHVESIDICGLRDDIIVDVDAEDCFNEPELVDHLGDDVPVAWNPPNLSAVACPTYGYDTGYSYDYAPLPDTGVDTADTGTPAPGWNFGSCASLFPIMVRGESGGEPFFGRVSAFLRVEPYLPGEYVPSPLHDVPREFSITGDAVAGGSVDIEFRIQAAIDDEGFRWWVDAGELVGTGRTAVQSQDGDWRVTTNTLRIPDDWHGPLRIYVVTESWYSDNVVYTADLTWEQTVLDVP